MNANLFEKANRIIRASSLASFSTLDKEGYPQVSTVSPIGPRNLFEAYFVVRPQTDQEECPLHDKKASLRYSANGSHITLSGEAELVTGQGESGICWPDYIAKHLPKGETTVVKFTSKQVSLQIGFERAQCAIDDLLNIQSRCGLLCGWCSFKSSHGCGGCVQTQGHPFHGECPVATCCQNKRHTHCGECADFPCQQLRQYSFNDPEHGDNPPGARLEVCKAWAARGEMG